MRYPFLTLLLLAVGVTSSLAASAAQGGRQHILMDSGWKFRLDNGVPLRDEQSVTGWSWRPTDNATATEMSTSRVPGTYGSRADQGDAPADIGDDVFKGARGFALFNAVLPKIAAAHRILHFTSVDDNATVFVNGVRIAHHDGWNDPFDVEIDPAWKRSGPNVVKVLVENTGGAGGILGPVTIGTKRALRSAITSGPGDDSDWRSVHLPHDFVVEGKFTPGADLTHGSLVAGAGWYRKTFNVPTTDRNKSLWLDFDGVYRNSRVYLNGHSIGIHACGYTPFHYDISRYVKYGSANLLAVYADARKFEGWWYEGGGIYRHVWLTKANKVHVAPWGVFVSSRLPEPDPAARPEGVTRATVDVKTSVANDGNSGATCGVTSTIVDDKGLVVGKGQSALVLSGGTSGDVLQHIPVSRPELWSIEKPTLYKLVTTVETRSGGTDRVSTAFGIRTIRFDAEKGFFLNGKAVKLLGTCNHQDFAGVGIAMPDSLLYWRVRKLKFMGSNAYRMSHNPPSSELLDACDRLGMLVMDENRHLGDTEESKAPPGTPYSDLSGLASMVLRDRNHPSIIMWSMCNEENLQGSAEGAHIFTAMRNKVRSLDATRPVTCGMNDSAHHGIALAEDIRGFNYMPESYVPYHHDHPELPIFGSETGSTLGTRGIYTWKKFSRDDKPMFGSPELGYVNAYDVNAAIWSETAEQAWTPQADAPFVAGGFAWTGFDYKGEPWPFGWPNISSSLGIMDTCGFHKDVYYYYKAWWTDAPVIHILPHWNWSGHEGESIPVWVYSNASRVELLLNGKEIGTKPMPQNGHVEWSVPYAPGTIIARGYDAHNRLISTDNVSTTGAPAGLRLSSDNAVVNANGEDVAMVEVDVIDAQGRIVPTASNRVQFHVTGAGHVAGVGNGNPTDHDPDKANNRSAFNGKCMVIVGASDQPGKIVLTASAAGLQSAAMTIAAR